MLKILYENKEYFFRESSYFSWRERNAALPNYETNSKTFVARVQETDCEPSRGFVFAIWGT